MANFNNGEQEILDNLNRGVSNIKERLMPVLNNKDLDNNSVSNENSLGKARVLERDNSFSQYGSTQSFKREENNNISNVTNYSNIASGDSSSFINNQSATSFVVVIMAILTFILVSVILGYGLFNLLNL